MLNYSIFTSKIFLVILNKYHSVTVNSSGTRGLDKNNIWRQCNQNELFIYLNKGNAVSPLWDPQIPYLINENILNSEFIT